MDDILHKNIFNDKDLCKLSPDYSPSDITLRMQVRRTLFRDSHSHSYFKSSNWHRKFNKRMKDGYKITKEIVKMRNEFRNTNLRNRITMKENINNITSQPGIKIYGGELLLNDIKIFNDDADQCIYDLQEDMSKLVLCNDSDFKINTKQRPEIVSVHNHSKNKSKNKISNTKPDDDSEDNNIKEHSIRLDITSKIKLTEQSAVEIQDISAPHINCNNDLTKNTENVLDGQVKNDLQTLLIMMAMSKTNDDFEIENPLNTSRVANQEMENGEEQDPYFLMPHSENSDISKVLNVTPLRIEMNHRQKYLVKKYSRKWKQHVSKKKEYMNKQRQETLNNFFDKLSKKKMNALQTSEIENKAKSFARDYNTYQHRYMVQKHIIALQKAKLEEQNRVIEELKYNKIVEASRQSVDAMKEEVRRTYYDIDRQLKPKIKCLTNELKLHEIQEPSLVLHCLKVPKFLQRMEKRAREREEKHALIRERRRQMEEDRIRLKQQAELAKAEMDKEEKLKRIKELREKRKKEKIESIRKKQHVERLRALIVMADLHYERSLMIRFGIRPFRRLLQIKRDNMEKAKMHYIFQLQKNVFLNWMFYTEDMWFERNYIAEDFYRKTLLRKTFSRLKLNVHSYTLQKQVADDFYDLYVMQLVFRKFREGIEIVKKENEMKWQMAVIYYNSNLSFKIFTCWRTLPALNALKREQEARKARWREKVLLVVPDYAPPDD
ncbi:trichohyalin [Ostrinia furnacalis]|uniref:trichohyalin n=1 Tax=Ostrinia furnacalis TaxID=93504 RepID=UPI00103C641E|nr:trichohyalin [Ostrinia furnacalis]